MDGLEVLRRIREWSQVPILILSVRDHEEEKIQALDLGADDYVNKPFAAGELLARLRAILRPSYRARKKIDPNNKGLIETEPRVGYRLILKS